MNPDNELDVELRTNQMLLK